MASFGRLNHGYVLMIHIYKQLGLLPLRAARNPRSYGYGWLLASAAALLEVYQFSSASVWNILRVL